MPSNTPVSKKHEKTKELPPQSSQLLSEQLTNMQLSTAKVTPMKGYYHVIMSGLEHIVVKETRKCYTHGESCLSVNAVIAYLKSGGEKAGDNPTLQPIPLTCPVCGGKVHYEPRLSSKVRGVGWACETSAEEEHKTYHVRGHIYGHLHYWRAQCKIKSGE